MRGCPWEALARKSLSIMPVYSVAVLAWLFLPQSMPRPFPLHSGSVWVTGWQTVAPIYLYSDWVINICSTSAARARWLLGGNLFRAPPAQYKYKSNAVRRRCASWRPLIVSWIHVSRIVPPMPPGAPLRPEILPLGACHGVPHLFGAAAAGRVMKKLNEIARRAVCELSSNPG